MRRRRFLENTVGLTVAGVAGCHRTAEGMARGEPGEGEDGLVGPEEPDLPPARESVDDEPEPSLEPEPTAEPGIPAELDGDFPDWTLGSSSTSSATVLMFRGNPSHTFYGTGPIAKQPKLLWRSKLARRHSEKSDGTPAYWIGTGWTGQAVVWGQRVFVGGVAGVFYCYERTTGAELWTFETEGVFKGSACLYRGRLYIGNTDNRIRCLDAKTGVQIWDYYNSRDCDSSPCVVDGRLYIGGEDGSVKCLDPDTGAELWKSKFGWGKGSPPGSGGIETSPAVVDGEVFVGHYDGFLLCLDAQTGTEKWRADTGADTDASPVVVGNLVYTACEETTSVVRCFDRSKSGALVWEFATRRGFWSTPAVVGDRLWIGGHDGKLYCLDAKTGAHLWSFDAGGPIWSSPCVVDGKVVFGSHAPYLFSLDAETGEELWRYEMNGRTFSTPCIVGGHIYVGSANGWFHCFA